MTVMPWLPIGVCVGVVLSMLAATLQDYWRNR